jgi:hypothetical protein
MHWIGRTRGLALAAAVAAAAWPAGASAQVNVDEGLQAVEDILSTITGNLPRDQGQPRHTIIVEGLGTGGTDYTIDGGGRLAQVEGTIHGFNATVGPNDVVRRNRAEGGVRGGNDAFLVYGRLPDIVLDNPRAADLWVDGEPYHTVVIDGTAGRRGRTGYTISGGGQLRQVDGRVGGLDVNIQPDDTVRGTRAEGTVSSGLDGYRVFGALPTVQLEHPARAAVIVDQVRQDSQQRPPRGRPDKGEFVNVEVDTDRPGGDYRNFALDRPRPNRCISACNNEQRCEAYTYVPPGVQGPDARCWLKDTVPDARTESGMISGVKRSPLPQRVNVDRTGGDYRDFAMRAAAPTRCATACARQNRCQAYTYVPPGRQGPDAHCWLKSRVPNASRAAGLVSGVK